MDFIADPAFYIAAVPAALLFGMSKGGFGGVAAGSIAIPLMALTVDPRTAAAVMLPVLMMMDATALWKFRGQFALAHLKIMLPAAMVGIALAGLMMNQVSADRLRLFLGLISVCFCLYYWWHPARTNKPGKLAGYFWSMVSGFTSTQIHAGGVPAGIYLYPQNLDKVILTGTMAIFFAVVNVVKLIPYGLLGQFNLTNLGTSIILLPLAPLGVLIGHQLLHRINEAAIYRILYAALFLAGLKLMYEGLT